MYNRIIRKLKQLTQKENFTLTQASHSSFIKGSRVNITNTNIVLTGKSELIIDDDVRLDGVNIYLNNGYCKIGSFTELVKGNQYISPAITVDEGKLIIGSNNIIKSNFIIRFGGYCTIGTYNAINEETEIRCDQSVTIGHFNIISYQCLIFDTNTHCIYPSAVRRAKTTADFPYIGIEREKPVTKQVSIGNDNWLGYRCTILKGCILGNEVIVGTGTVASNINADKGILAGNPARVINRNDLE
jgi:acetyltransferase-like isoleucine patch superfamily enzyme